MEPIEVITAPTDWAAVVAAVVTGVTAVVGIIATSWQTRTAQKAASRELSRNLKAQADLMEIGNSAAQLRAIYAQKLHTYAAFQSASDRLIAVAERGEPDGDFSEAHSVMIRTAAEVELVAPEDIGDLTYKVKRAISRGSGSRGFRSDFDLHRTHEELKALAEEMKIDLARYHPQPEAEVVPEQDEAVMTRVKRRTLIGMTRRIRGARARES